MDVSTGEFLTTEIAADRLASELAKFRPAECVASFPLDWEGNSLQILDEAAFSAESTSAALKGRFGRLEGAAPSRPCRSRCGPAGAILSYLHSLTSMHLDTCMTSVATAVRSSWSWMM